jgi:hypothetical protein
MRELVEFKIENRPVIRARTFRNQYPFGRMKVGQSFFIPPGLVDVMAVRQAALHYGKRHNAKFSIIKDGDGYRCGRIA